MGAAAVLLSERLRVWQGAGLRYVWAPGQGSPLEAPAPANSRTCPAREAGGATRTGTNTGVESGAASGAHAWPAPWDAYRARLAVPSRTVWTYADLSTDFGAAPSPERRQFFARLLGELHWPKGSVTFWPMNADLGQGLNPDPARFWQGVREAQARTVVCFGAAAFSALLPAEEFSLRMFRAQGLRLAALPDPRDMLADPASRSLALNMLKTLRQP